MTELDARDRLAAEIDKHWLTRPGAKVGCSCGGWEVAILDLDPEQGYFPAFSRHVADRLLAAGVLPPEPAYVGYPTKQAAWEDGYDAGVTQGRHLAALEAASVPPPAAPGLRPCVGCYLDPDCPTHGDAALAETP